MAEVGVRELKARLSAHLRRAQAGERLIVTDRGKPVAALGPIEDEAVPPAWLVQLAREGRARLGRGRAAIGSQSRVPLKGGATLSRAVIEDRR
jgi:prevent-host-death family protein